MCIKYVDFCHSSSPIVLKHSYCAPAAAVFACCCGVIFLPSLLKRTRGGGARLRRPSRERTLLNVRRGLEKDKGGHTEQSFREWRN
jgi:hypothetical protein